MCEKLEKEIREISQELEKRVEAYRDNLFRMTELKKGLIDAEMTLASLKRALNLSLYDWKKLVNLRRT